MVAAEALTPRLEGQKFVAYYRVSTAPQGVSGLGLDAQRIAVEKFVASMSGTIIAGFTEIESGRKSERYRPQLLRALARCRRRRAVLVIARLDRLARNVAMIARLMEARVEFVAADLPMANRLTIHFLAAVAEYAADLLAKRRAEAIESMRRQGRRIGTQCISREKMIEMQRLSALAAAARHERFVQATMPIIHDLRRQGIRGYKAIAKALTAQGVPTASGRGRWYIDTVRKLIKAHEPGYVVPRAKLQHEHSLRLIAARHAAVNRLADARAREWAPILEELASHGVLADRDVARKMRERGVRRPYGGVWTSEGVRQLRERLSRLSADPNHMFGR